MNTKQYVDALIEIVQASPLALEEGKDRERFTKLFNLAIQYKYFVISPEDEAAFPDFFKALKEKKNPVPTCESEMAFVLINRLFASLNKSLLSKDPWLLIIQGLNFNQTVGDFKLGQYNYNGMDLPYSNKAYRQLYEASTGKTIDTESWGTLAWKVASALGYFTVAQEALNNVTNSPGRKNSPSRAAASKAEAPQSSTTAPMLTQGKTLNENAIPAGRAARRNDDDDDDDDDELEVAVKRRVVPAPGSYDPSNKKFKST
jgi:hypothetical protein